MSNARDAGLLRLAAKCAEARRTREEGLDRLAAAAADRPPSSLETDADLLERDAAYRAADDEFEALAFVLAMAPATTLAGALAKASAMPDGDDTADRASYVVGRLNAGDDALAARVASAVQCLSCSRSRRAHSRK